MKDSFQDLIDTNFFAYAKHEIILEDNEPVDYVFLEVNKAFENMTGLKASQILNKRVSIVIPEIKEDEFDWIKFYGKLAIEGGKEEFKQYSLALNRWYKVQAFSSKKNIFTTIFTDVSHEQLIANIAAEINNFNTNNIDYSKLLETIKIISGAEYAAFNKFDKAGKDYTTIAVTGINRNIKKAINLLGFELTGKTWKYDPKREAKLKDNKTTVFNSLNDLSGKNFSKRIADLITSSFNIGNIVIIKTQKGVRTIGDFTLIFDKNSKLRNQKLAESFADIIGSAIARIESEEELKISVQKFKGIFNESVAAVYLFDNHKNFIDSNQAGIDLLGYQKKELLELHIKDVDADPKEVQDAHKKLLIGDRIINYEHKLKRKDGKIITVLNNSRSVKNEKGEVTGLLSTLIDISERKNLEERYKLLAEQYKLINDNLEIGIVLIDKKMDIISINSKMQEWFGTEDNKENQKCYNTFAKKPLEYNKICKDCPVIDTFKTKEIQQTEKIYDLSSGSMIFNITTSPVINNNKDVEFVIEMFEDVTERRMSENAIIQSERRHKEQQSFLDSLLESIPAPIFYKNDNLIYTGCNKAFTTFIGKSKNEIIGKNAYDINPPELAKLYDNKDRELIRSEGKQIYESTVRNANGENMDVVFHKAPIKNTNGEISGIIGVILDVTEQKKLETIIKQESELNQIISDISADLIIVDSSNIDKKINSILQIVGEYYSVDRAYIFRFTEDNHYFSNTHEWCADNISKEIDNIQDIHFDEYPFWKSKVLSSKIVNISDVDGISEKFTKEKQEFKRQKIKSLLTVPLLIKNKVIGVIGFDSVYKTRKWTNKDITSLKLVANILSDTFAKINSEQEILLKSELQAIIMNIAKIYINMPVHEYAKYINESLKEICNFVKADRAYIFDYDFINNTCSNTYEWCAEGISPEIDNLQNSPLDSIPQWVSRHKEGLEFFLPNVSLLPDDGPNGLKSLLEPQGIKSLITFPLLDNKELIGFVGFDSVRKHHLYSESDKQLLNVYAQLLVNLYNRIKNIKQIEDEKLKAEKASKTKSEFLANMSHEIRTPLNGVIGFSELIKNTELNQRQVQYINNINTSAIALMGIIDDILDFSKIEAGKLKLDFIKTNISDISNQAANIVYLDAHKKGIELFINIQDNVPDYITADSIRLKQVLVNLLGNAVKFTANGEIELKISFKNTNKKKGKIIFSVIDTGIGISEQQQRKLFKAFSQADSSTERKFGGTGLGLAISQIIVNKMNGKIEIKSEIDKGSEFYFEIETEHEYKQKSKEVISYSKVLVIIENNKINNLITEKLKKLNTFDIESLDSLPEKIFTERYNDTDLIIADFHLLNDRVLDLARGKNKQKQSGVKIITLFTPYELARLEILTKGKPNIIKLAKPVNTNCVLENVNAPQKMFDTQWSINQDLQLLPALFKIRDKKHVILLAEDNEVNMMLLEMMIEELLPDTIVFKAVNGAEVIEMYDNYYPSLIFMDVQMPVISGLEATEIIRKKELGTEKQVPIIAITAGAILEEKQKCFEAGMNDFITKPIDKYKLTESLIKYL